MNTKEMLATNMAFMYRLMVASEPLLERAIASCEEGPLRDYLLHHLEQERGHVDLLKTDLATLGAPDPVPRYWLATLMAGAQYYLIEHEHPAALLGYMSALEGSTLSLSTVAELEAAYGPLPCLRLHSERDPGHHAELCEQIERLPDGLKDLAQENRRRVLEQMAAVPRVIFAELPPLIH